MILADLIVEYCQLTVHLVCSPAPIIIVANVILKLGIPTQLPQRFSAGGICHQQRIIKFKLIFYLYNIPKERGIKYLGFPLQGKRENMA
jgi:hypothetical protein